MFAGPLITWLEQKLGKLDVEDATAATPHSTSDELCPFLEFMRVIRQKANGKWEFQDALETSADLAAGLRSTTNQITALGRKLTEV